MMERKYYKSAMGRIFLAHIDDKAIVFVKFWNNTDALIQKVTKRNQNSAYNRLKEYCKEYIEIDVIEFKTNYKKAYDIFYSTITWHIPV